MAKYTYGEEVKYTFTLLHSADKNTLSNFSCGNEQLDNYIHNELIKNDTVINEDGLTFKVVDDSDGAIIAIISLAANGIIFTQTNFVKVLPSIKIDIFAVDKAYQKMHFDESSKNALNSNGHFYLSDCIMCEVIKHCNEISKNDALVNFILLYADKKAYRFYKRNYFLNFEDYMEKENNMEINENIPMYMKL